MSHDSTTVTHGNTALPTWKVAAQTERQIRAILAGQVSTSLVSAHLVSAPVPAGACLSCVCVHMRRWSEFISHLSLSRIINIWSHMHTHSTLLHSSCDTNGQSFYTALSIPPNTSDSFSLQNHGDGANVALCRALSQCFWMHHKLVWIMRFRITIYTVRENGFITCPVSVITAIHIFPSFHLERLCALTPSGTVLLIVKMSMMYRLVVNRMLLL